MKLELNEIFAVIDKVKEAGLASFTYEDEDISLKLKGPAVHGRGGVRGHRFAARGAGQTGYDGDAGERGQTLWSEPSAEDAVGNGSFAGHQESAAQADREKSGGKDGNSASKDGAETAQEGNLQTSPMVGVFYASDQEGGEPLVKVGDQVQVGQVIGIVEAMKLMNEIKAEYAGTVKEVLAENGQMVEYGQPLFRIV